MKGASSMEWAIGCVETHHAQELEAQGYAVHAWSNGPHFAYPVHSHVYDKMIIVTRGSIRFHFTRPAASHALRAGDRLAIPSGAAHSAVTGPEGVACLEGQR